MSAVGVRNPRAFVVWFRDLHRWSVSSIPARNHFRARAKFTTNLASINSTDLRELSVPLPPLAVQQATMKRVDAGRAEIAKLKADAKTRADAAKADVEAMILGTKPVG